MSVSLLRVVPVLLGSAILSACVAVPVSSPSPRYDEPGWPVPAPSGSSVPNVADGFAALVGRYGELVNAQGECVSSNGDSRTVNATLILRSCQGDTYQQWTYDERDQSLRSLGGQCLDSYNGGKRAGSRLILRQCDSTPSQRWTYFSYGGAANTRNGNGLCMENSHGNLLQLADCLLRPSQHFWGRALSGSGYSGTPTVVVPVPYYGDDGYREGYRDGREDTWYSAPLYPIAPPHYRHPAPFHPVNPPPPPVAPRHPIPTPPPAIYNRDENTGYHNRDGRYDGRDLRREEAEKERARRQPPAYQPPMQQAPVKQPDLPHVREPVNPSPITPNYPPVSNPRPDNPARLPNPDHQSGGRTRQPAPMSTTPAPEIPRPRSEPLKQQVPVMREPQKSSTDTGSMPIPASPPVSTPQPWQDDAYRNRDGRYSGGSRNK